jgi:hypothetical protein
MPPRRLEPDRHGRTRYRVISFDTNNREGVEEKELAR